MEKEVYKGNIVRVTEEKIGETIWERTYVPDGVIIFPVSSEGKIILIEERRPHEIPNVRIKAVSGILEHHKGTPEENAQREMQEEIGFRANEIIPLMTIKNTGTINSTQYFFVARGLVPSKLPNPDGEDVILSTKLFTPDELYNALMEDRLRWSTTALGIFRLINLLERGL